MPIITLTTDFGTIDHYVASIKGTILKLVPEVTIVDITHDIPLSDIIRTAHIIRNCYQDFPDGTIHIIGVEPQNEKHNSHVVVYNHKQYFICPDNGILSLIFDTPPEKAFEISIQQEADKECFPVKDIYVKAACNLAKREPIEVIGKPKSELNRKINFAPTNTANSIQGMISYIDHYGNLHSNIHESLFKSVGKNRPFGIFLKSRTADVKILSKRYTDVEKSGVLALFNSSGYLEIAMRNGNLNKLSGLKTMEKFDILFHD
ncbi:MAG: SAM-dependent chlorinase/fluorinase [Flavobacteriales bacterium]|nr:SAM-dependent chlorinase/fluorinase [Flavobacteriales bacterium]